MTRAEKSTGRVQSVITAAPRTSPHRRRRRRRSNI